MRDLISELAEAAAGSKEYGGSDLDKVVDSFALSHRGIAKSSRAGDTIVYTLKDGSLFKVTSKKVGATEFSWTFSPAPVSGKSQIPYEDHDEVASEILRVTR